MKNAIIPFILFTTFSTLSCKDDEPSLDPLIRDNRLFVGIVTSTEDLVYLGSNYAPIFSEALDETFIRLSNDGQIKSGLKEIPGESEFRGLLDSALQNVFDEIVIQLSNELGDSISQAKRRTGNIRNMKQFGVGIHDAPSFDQALIAQMDSSLASIDRKHNNWSDLVVVSQAAGLLVPDSIEIDLTRTLKVFDETIYPRIQVMLQDETSWKETIQFLLLQGFYGEAILLSFYIPALNAIDFDKLTAASDTISRSRGGAGNDTLLGMRGNDVGVTENVGYSRGFLDYIHRASFLGLISGLLPDPEFPEFNRPADVITSMYYGMYSATFYAYLDYLWETLHDGRLNTQAILDDFIFYQKLFDSDNIVALDISLTGVNSDNHSQLKASYLQTMASAVEVALIPSFTAFTGRNGESHTPVSHSTGYLMELLKPSTEYNGTDSVVDQLISILDSTTIRRAGVLVSSYSIMGNSDLSELDIQSLIGWYDQPNLKNELDDATRSFQIDLMNQLIYEDNPIASIILPAVQGAKAAARKGKSTLDFNSLIAEISGTEPIDLEKELDTWEKEAADFGFYGFGRSWLTASDYECEDFHCLMMNFHYEMYRHIMMFYFHQIWEYSNHLANQQTAKNLSTEAETYASLFLNTLNATLGAMSNADTAESITNRANNFSDYVGNAHEFVGGKYQQSITTLSSQLEIDPPNAKNSLSSFFDEFGTSQDISADLGFKVAQLLSENTSDSDWLMEVYNSNDPRLYKPVTNHSIQSVSKSSIQSDLTYFLENQGDLQSEDIVLRHVKMRDAGHSIISGVLLNLLDKNDGMLLNEGHIKSYLQTALDTETLPNIDSRIQKWNQEIIHDVLLMAVLFTFLEEDSYNCIGDDPCKYVNLNGDAYQLSYYYLLGKFWSYIQEVNG